MKNRFSLRYVNRVTKDLNLKEDGKRFCNFKDKLKIRKRNINCVSHHRLKLLKKKMEMATLKLRNTDRIINFASS